MLDRVVKILGLEIFGKKSAEGQTAPMQPASPAPSSPEASQARIEQLTRNSAGVGQESAEGVFQAVPAPGEQLTPQPTQEMPQSAAGATLPPISQPHAAAPIETAQETSQPSGDFPNVPPMESPTPAPQQTSNQTEAPAPAPTPGEKAA